MLSPTILVEDGAERASISRTQVAKLIYTETTNDNGTQTTNQVEAEEEAPFELVLEGVEVYPANRTVRMGVTIKNKRFTESNINDITTAAQADYTEDTIETAFTAAPGDVIVLAGLAANSRTQPREACLARPGPSPHWRRLLAALTKCLAMSAR